MSLLEALGLHPLPAKAGGAAPATRARGQRPGEGGDDDESQEELARWPNKAHVAWKRLDRVKQTAVLVLMAKRYGNDFAKDFAKFTHGGTRLEGGDFVPPLETQTPEALKKRGYRLAQRGGTTETTQEWWVHPNGHVIYLQIPGVRKQPAPEKKPCSPEMQDLIKMTLGWLKDALADKQQAQQDLETAKAALDAMDITSKAFADAYASYAQDLDTAIDETQKLIDSVEEELAPLEGTDCDVAVLTSGRDDLTELHTGFEAQKDLFEHDLRKPIRVDVKDTPNDP